jgi:epoxyqueuosine reductase
VTPAAAAALAAALEQEAARLGFAAAGIARLQPSEHARFFQHWLEEGRHGGMAWLARPDAIAKRIDPGAAWPELRVALVVAENYAPPAAEESGDVEAARSGREGDPASRGIIARYARGRDYHTVLKKKLLALLAWLEREVGVEMPEARAYVDTGPLLERELARRAGLGWFGRNTLLIHPRRGSYFFLGCLLLPLDLPADPPFEAEHCGTCNACVDACPTGALLGRAADGAPVMDARRCISYLTIEHRGPIPHELRPLIGNRIFGCDICQEVCPFNIRFAAESAEPGYAARGPGEPPPGVEPRKTDAPHPGTAAPPLVALLKTALDEAAWDSFSRGSAIRRPGRAGFARNVCVGLGSRGAPEAVPVLASALGDPEPMVGAHAAWALGRIGSPAAITALEKNLAPDPPRT